MGKTAGKDKLENKMTYVSVYGLNEAKNIFYSLIEKNHVILSELNISSNIFNQIDNMLIEKVKK